MSFFLQEQQKISVALIISRPLIQYSFRQLLKNHAYIKITEQCDNGLEGVKLLRQTSANIVIIDASLDGVGAYEMIARYNRGEGKAHIIIHLDEINQSNSDLIRYIKSGAMAIISPTQSIESILESINKVSRGEHHLPPEFTQDCSFLRMGKNIDVNLSSREQQVLKLIIEGQKSINIAEILSLSIKTVECHRANLRRKFNVNNVVDLIHKSQLIGFC